MPDKAQHTLYNSAAHGMGPQDSVVNYCVLTCAGTIKAKLPIMASHRALTLSRRRDARQLLGSGLHIALHTMVWRGVHTS